MPGRTIRDVNTHGQGSAISPVIGFVGGLGRTLDLGGALNRYPADYLMEIHRQIRARRLAASSGPEADAEAIGRDWNAVGQLLYHAMGRFEEYADRR